MEHAGTFLDIRKILILSIAGNMPDAATAISLFMTKTRSRRWMVCGIGITRDITPDLKLGNILGVFTGCVLTLFKRLLCVELNMAEEQRLAFIEQHDGVKGAVDFARQGMQIYRTCVLRSRKRGFGNPHHASLPEYRRGFIESYLAFKNYVKTHNAMLSGTETEPTTKRDA